MGNKWSVYMWHMLKTVFQNIGLESVTFEKSDDIITFKVPLLLLQH
jgi:hypothetical protein